VIVEMTIVAAVIRPSITALEDARTVISAVGTCEIARRPSSMECGVSVPVAKGAMVVYLFVS
jgi:hypothetical protein